MRSSTSSRPSWVENAAVASQTAGRSPGGGVGEDPLRERDGGDPVAARLEEFALDPLGQPCRIHLRAGGGDAGAGRAFPPMAASQSACDAGAVMRPSASARTWWRSAAGPNGCLTDSQSPSERIALVAATVE